MLCQKISLLSKSEGEGKINSLAEELNGIDDGFQLFIIGRPVDLSLYLEDQQEKARMEQNFIKKQVLRGYIQEASRIAASGEITEKHYYYILIEKNDGNKAEEELINKLEHFNTSLSQAGLTTYICQYDENMEVYSLFYSQAKAL